MGGGRDEALELAVEEFLERARAGERPDPEEHASRYPALADELKPVLAVAALMGDVSPEVATQDMGGPPQGTPQGELGPVGPPPLPGYEVIDQLPAGGMGLVYRVRHTALDQLRAVKVVRADAVTPGRLWRFRQEMRVLAHLDGHPAIVPVYEAGVCAGQPYFVMPLVGGGSAHERRGRYKGDAEAAARLVERVARAVDFAHGRGVLHRDLKPANILLTEDGEPRVADFGLAKLLDGGPHEEPAGPDTRDADSGPTQEGTVVGTLAYIAPEYLRGRSAPPAPAGDIWSLGVILYQLVTGERPFPGETREDVLRAIEAGPPEPLGRAAPAAGRTLDRVVSRCLDPQPGGRFRTAGELADALAGWRRGGAVPGETWGRWAGRQFRRLGPWALAAAAAACLWLAVGTTPAADTEFRSGTESTLDRLDRGEAAALIRPGADVPPHFVRFGSAKASPGAAVKFAARGPTLIELLPRAPRGDFRVVAEVAQLLDHRPGPAHTQVGVYWAYHEAETDAGRMRFLAGLTFQQESRGSPFGRPVRTVRPELRCWFFGDHATAPYRQQRVWADYRGHPDGREEVAPHGYRRLVLEVRGRSVRASWDGGRLPLAEVGPADFARVERLWRAGPTIRRSYPELAEIPCRLPHAGALGLFINDSTALVRHFAVEPIPRPAEE